MPEGQAHQAKQSILHAECAVRLHCDKIAIVHSTSTKGHIEVTVFLKPRVRLVNLYSLSDPLRCVNLKVVFYVKLAI